MKKLGVFAFGLFFLAACSDQAGQESEISEASSEQMAVSSESTENNGEAETTQINMIVGTTTITGTIDDSITSQAFITSLPQTFTMISYDDREYYSRIEALSEEGNQIANFSNGDICYYPAGPSLAIFFGGEERSSQAGLIKMGEITSDLETFQNLDDEIEMIIEVAN